MFIDLSDKQTDNKVDTTIINPKEISYDEYGNKTAGLIGLTKDKTKYIVTKQLVDKYNSLITKYKKQGITILKSKNEGVNKYKDDYYTIEKYAFYEFIKLNIINNNPNLITK
jgi:hypothetical protein